MKFTTAFNCGDRGWVYDGKKGATQLTIGQIRITYTNSKGVNDGAIDPGFPGIAFDNFKAKTSYEESYMCVETGIGSGSVYTFGKSIFKTEAECLTANAARIAEQKKHEEADMKKRIQAAMWRLAEAKRELAKLGA
jgi:hypothetical protein